MRKILVLFLFVFSSILLMAQTPYEVTANVVNVRESATSSATVVGTLKKGTQVNVYEIEQGWATIRYKSQFAYVSSKYIKQVKRANNSAISEKPSKPYTVSLLDILPEGSYDSYLLVFVIIGFSVVLLIFRKIRKKTGGYLKGGLYVTNMVFFIFTCLVMLYYFYDMSSEALWLFLPDTVGWLCVLTFPILGYCVYNQVNSYLEVMIDFRSNHGEFNMHWGLFSVFIGLIAHWVTKQWLPELNIWVWIAIGIFQAIQIVLIFRGVLANTGSKSIVAGILISLIGVLLYLIGLIATLIILIPFSILLIVVVIIGYIVYVSLTHPVPPSEYPKRGTIKFEDEWGRQREITGTFLYYDSFESNEGKRYRRKYADTWVEE